MFYDHTIGAKLKLRRAISPVDVEVNNIICEALNHDYALTLAAANKDFVEILVKDSAGHSGTVQYFLPELVVCSCAQYHKMGAGFCKHIAVSSAILKQPVTSEENIFSFNVNSYVKPLNKLKTKKYIVYDSLKGSNVTFGSSRIEQKSVSCLANEKYLTMAYELSLQLPAQLPPEVEVTDEIFLYPYQRDVLENMMTARRAICSMTTGAGKTLTSIAGLKILGGCKLKTLIVCPKSIATQWNREVKRVLDTECYMITSDNATSYSGGVGIVTYQTFSKNIDFFKTISFDLVIADEIQFIKNDQSKTWGSFKKLKTQYFWGLSGTLIENKLDDLYSIIQVVAPGLLGPKWKFDYRYKKIESIHKRKVIYLNEVQNIEELRDTIKSHVFSYSNLDLPPISFFKHYVSMDDDSTEKHDYFIDQANALISKSLNSDLTMYEKAMIQSFLLKARQICNTEELISKIPTAPNAKIRKILELVADICVKNNRKLVIFSEWTEMISILTRELAHLNLDIAHLDGSMTSKKREQELDRFRNDPNCKIFISSDAGGAGVDGLQLVCSDILHVELPWNPGRLKQRNGRLHRLKQTKPVSVYHIITNNSIEMKLEKTLEDKTQVRLDVLN